MTAPGSSAGVSLDAGGRGAAAPAGACRACGARAGSGVCTLAGSVACALGRGGGETCGGSVRSTAFGDDGGASRGAGGGGLRRRAGAATPGGAAPTAGARRVSLTGAAAARG